MIHRMFVSFVMFFLSVLNAQGAVYTSPPNGGAWGTYPNCVYPAVPLEVHSWWDEDLEPAVHDEAIRYTNDDAPRHVHLATCIPNARNDGSVALADNQKHPFIVRVMSFNNPSNINFVRGGFQSSFSFNTTVNMSCNTTVRSHVYMGGRSECTWYMDAVLDTAIEGAYGTNEVRLTPNIRSHVDLGSRQFATLNYQVKVNNGRTNIYRPTNTNIGRSWYTGMDYTNMDLNYIDTFDLPAFKAKNSTRAVPLVKGVIPLKVGFTNGNQKGIIWQDMGHHANPTFWKGKTTVGTVDPVSGGKIIYVSTGQGKFNFNWDTTGLADGRHWLYVQNQSNAAGGVQASAIVFLFDVCNKKTC